MQQSDKEKLTFSEQLDELTKAERKYPLKDFPKVSIIIPTCNSSTLISPTIESVLEQNYPDFELLIIDASDDRTLDIIRSFRSEKIRIYSVGDCRRYQMLNKGISQAEGEYINFLFPGDFYLHPSSIKLLLSLALDEDKPTMVYCGTLLRQAKEETKVLYRPLTLDLLKRGQQPTSLQSCIFRTDFLSEVGKFDPTYNMRGGFELLCRLFLSRGFRYGSINRVLTDYDLRAITRYMVFEHFWETMSIIYRYFGLWSTIKWLFIQKDLKRLIKSWLHSFRIAFSGR